MKLFVTLSFLILATTAASSQNNKPCYERIYQVTDTLPKINSSVETILQHIKQEIQLPDSLLTRDGFIFIKYVINCHGDAVSLRVIKTADSDGVLAINNFEYLAKTIIPILKRELKWIPAWEGGRTVDFLQIFSISFKKGVISIKVNAN